jgi:hypothetical protein
MRKSIVYFCMSMIFLYLLFSFFTLNFNPLEWRFLVRFMYGFFFTIGFLKMISDDY